MTFERFPGGKLDFVKSQPWGDQDRGQRMVPLGVTPIDSAPTGNPRTYTVTDSMAVPGGFLIAYIYSQEDVPTVVTGLSALWLRLESDRSAVSSFAAVGLFLGVLPRNLTTSRTVSVTYASIATGGAGFMALAAKRTPLLLGSAKAHASGSSTDTLTVAAVGGRLAVSMNFGRSGLAPAPSGFKTELVSGGIHIATKQILPGDPVTASWAAVGEHASIMVVLG
jgi:hypothetical protein